MNDCLKIFPLLTKTIILRYYNITSWKKIKCFFEEESWQKKKRLKLKDW